MAFPQLVVRRSTLDLDCEDFWQAAARLRRCTSDADLFYGSYAKDDDEASVSTSEPASSGSEETSSTTSESEDARTTLMLRNLPKTYTRSWLQRLLDSEGFIGCYSFLYVPTDFKSLATSGFGFVGFSDHAAAVRAKRHFQGFSGWGVGCRKRCNTAWSGAVQGLEDHTQRYRNSSVMHPLVPDELKPAVFVAGVRVPFPAPTREIAPPSFRFSITGEVVAPPVSQR